MNKKEKTPTNWWMDLKEFIMGMGCALIGTLVLTLVVKVTWTGMKWVWNLW